MNQPEFRLALGAFSAVVVPTIALHFTAGDERVAAGLTAPPFGWIRVLVAHLVTSLPFGFILAGWIRSIANFRESPPWKWVVGGIAAIVLVLLVGPGTGEAVSAGDVGPVVALLFRSILAVTLVLPWCVASYDPVGQWRRSARHGMMLGVGMCMAVVPCGLYTNAVISARTEQTAELLSRERLVGAEMRLEGLCELGSDLSVLNRSPSEVRRALAAAIPKLKQAASSPLPVSASSAARLNRAVLLIRLDQLDAAAKVLESLAPTETAQLLLASVYRDQQRWSESDSLYAQVLEKSLPSASGDFNARDTCLKAIEGLVFNARAERRPADAERALQLGLASIPAEAAHFHFQLGRHYADGGHAIQAAKHLQTATALDPAKFRDVADKILSQLRVATPACLGPLGMTADTARPGGHLPHGL